MTRDQLSAPRTRCLAVWAATTAGAAALTGLLVPDLRGPVPGRFDEALVLVCEAVLLSCAGWAWLVTTVVVLDAARGRPRRRRGVPPSVCRAVLAACGVALVGGLAQPAYADPAQRDRRAPTTTAVVHGVSLPERAGAGGHVGRFLALRARAEGRSTPDHRRALVVRPGDTLWGLAEHSLGDGAAWPRLYRANRGVLGADPDLIRPGQRLVLPRREESR